MATKKAEKKTRKLTQKQKRAQRKRLFVIIAVVLIVGIAGIGGYLHFHNRKADPIDSQRAFYGLPAKTEADAVFKRYVAKYVDAKSLYHEESYSGTGTKMTAKSSINVTGKQLISAIDLDCTAHVNNMDVMLRASVQQENTTTYIRLNDIAGNATDENGQRQYLSDLYSKVKGNWYKASEADIAIQSQLDSSVFVTDSGVIAPGHDAQQIAIALIGNGVNGAYQYSLQKRDGDNFVYSLHVNQEEYLGAVQRSFPNLASPDDVVNMLFTAGSDLDSTLTIAKDGTLIKQETSQPNICKSVMSEFTGVDVSAIDAPSILTGTSVIKPSSNDKLAPIANSKPSEVLKNDLLY